MNNLPTYKTGQLNLKVIVTIFVILASLAGAFLFIRKKSTSTPSKPKIIDSIEIGKTFEFPGFNPKTGEALGRVNFTIVSAEKTDLITVKNEPYKPPKDKIFLSLNIELENQTTKELGFFSRNLVRLLIDDKPFAPQFYNKGVTVAPIATKKDKLGLTVDAKQKEFKLQVGELGGEKEVIELKFNK